MINDKKILRKLDVVFGVVLVIAGIIIAVEAFKMPWNGISGGGALAAPGLLPLIIGVIIAICGVILAYSAYKEGARVSKADLTAALAALRSSPAIRIYVMLAIIGIYIFILIGRIPFFLATFIFIATFFLYVRAGKWWSCLILAAIVAAAISFCFGTLLAIPLP